MDDLAVFSEGLKNSTLNFFGRSYRGSPLHSYWNCRFMYLTFLEPLNSGSEPSSKANSEAIEIAFS